MNKSLTPDEVKDLLASVKLTRFDRMMMWAAAVAVYPRQLSMFHGIEHVPPDQLSRATIYGTTIFDLGHREPVLAQEGLSSNNVRENMDFFQLSHDELHYLSCDCHGEVPNSMVAQRIAILASMKPGEYCEPRNPDRIPMISTLIYATDIS